MMTEFLVIKESYLEKVIIPMVDKSVERKYSNYKNMILKYELKFFNLSF